MKKEEVDVKQKILEVAKQIFNRKDYHETVTDEIAKEANVAKGTVFFYFKSKDNLFKEIMFSLYEDVKKIVKETIEDYSLPPLKRLKLLYDRYIDFNIKNMHLMMTLRKEMTKTESIIKEELVPKFSEIVQLIKVLVEEMFARKILKRRHTEIDLENIISGMLLAIGTAVVSMVMFIKDNKEFEHIKELFWEILLHGILEEDVSLEMLYFGTEKT